MKTYVIKPIYIILGSIFLLLAILGVLLPLLPTTPFALLSVYFFSRSSKTIHMKILKMPVIGQTILDWEECGVIKPKTKVMLFIILIVSVTVLMIRETIPLWGKAVILICYFLLGTFIYRRPSI